MKSLEKPSVVEYLSPTETLPIQSDWYEVANEDHFWMQARFNALKIQLDRLGDFTQRPLRALDVGGGNGVVKAQIERDWAWIVDCADLNPEALERMKPGKGRNFCYDILQPHPSLKGAYDVVLLLEILEHLEDTDKFIDAALMHLRPGGILVIGVPALTALYSKYDRVVGHLRRYDRASLAKACGRPGSELVSCNYWAASLLPVGVLRKLLLYFVPESKVVKVGFAPPSDLVNRTLRLVLAGERRLTRAPGLGASLFAILKKK